MQNSSWKKNTQVLCFTERSHCVQDRKGQDRIWLDETLQNRVGYDSRAEGRRGHDMIEHDRIWLDIE